MHEVVGLGEPGLIRQPAAADPVLHLDDLKSEIMDEGHTIYEVLQFGYGYFGHG